MWTSLVTKEMPQVGHPGNLWPWLTKHILLHLLLGGNTEGGRELCGFKIRKNWGPQGVLVQSSLPALPDTWARAGASVVVFVGRNGELG